MSLQGILEAGKNAGTGWLMTLEEPGQTIVNGEATDGFTVRGELLMAAEWLSGTDSSGLVSQATYQFIGKPLPNVTITPTWRLGKKDTNRKFQVTAVGDPNGRGRLLVVVAKELV